MTRSRSTTPPAQAAPPPKPKIPNQPGHPHRVEFSPLCAGRRGSNNTNSNSRYNSRPKLQTRDSIDKDKQRRLELIARTKARREAMLKRVRKEKKLMLLSSILAFLALFIWFVAVFTDHWFHVTQPEEMIQQAFNKSMSEVFISSYTGLWRTCQTFQHISGERREECPYFSIFLTNREEAEEGLNTHNEHVIDYTRALISFAFISVLLMGMTIVAAFYTFKNSRYVYKRLASSLYFMTTISLLVVLEVLVTSVNYAEVKIYPPGAIVIYGFSFYMGWSVFLVYLVNGCIFLILSRKRKRDKELEDDDTDGGLISGR